MPGRFPVRLSFGFWRFFSFRFTIAQMPSQGEKPADKDRLVSAVQGEDDASFELKLRPRYVREFIGKKKVKDNLSVAIEAAKSRGEALDHVLLYGPPGLGKTTLATIIANELGVAYQQSAGPAIQIKGDLTAILTNLTDRQVLFLDEVHRLQAALEEILYSALEDYKWASITGKDHRRERTPLTCGHSPLSPPPRGLDYLRRRCARVSEFCSAWSSIPTRNSSSSSSGQRRFWASPSTMRAQRSLPDAPAVRRASPTDCCGGYAILLKCAARGGLTGQRRKPHWRCLKSIATASMK